MRCGGCGADNDDWSKECWMCGEGLKPTSNKSNYYYGNTKVTYVFDA